jgi:FkbM family methyltransferase
MQSTSFYAALPNPAHVDGFRLHHDGQASVNVNALIMGMFEPETTQLFKRMLAPGMTVIDVGANVGYYSLLAAQAIGSTGHVWAFEPVPSTVALIHKSVDDNGCADRIQVCPCAVGASAGTARIYLGPEDSGTSNLFIPHTEYVDVPVTTLDTWAAAQGWPTVDVVKMDIEGAERDALQGMPELSRRNPQMRLIVEFNPTTMQAAGVTADEFFTVLQSRGFDRIALIGKKVCRLDLASDIPRLVREARRRGNVNLLCEKEGATTCEVA